MRWRVTHVYSRDKVAGTQMGPNEIAFRVQEPGGRFMLMGITGESRNKALGLILAMLREGKELTRSGWLNPPQGFSVRVLSEPTQIEWEDRN